MSPYELTCNNLINGNWITGGSCSNVACPIAGCDGMAICNPGLGTISDCFWRNNPSACNINLNLSGKTLKNVVFGKGCDHLRIEGTADDVVFENVLFQAFQSVTFDGFSWTSPVMDKSDLTIRTRPRTLNFTNPSVSFSMTDFNGGDIEITIDAKMDPYVLGGLEWANPWFVDFEMFSTTTGMSPSLLKFNFDVVGKVILSDPTEANGGIVTFTNCAFDHKVVMKGDIRGEISHGGGTGMMVGYGLRFEGTPFFFGFTGPISEEEKSSLTIDVDIAQNSVAIDQGYGFYANNWDILGAYDVTMEVDARISAEFARGAYFPRWQTSGDSNFRVVVRGDMEAGNGGGIEMVYPQSSAELSLMELQSYVSMQCSTDCVGVNLRQGMGSFGYFSYSSFYSDFSFSFSILILSFSHFFPLKYPCNLSHRLLSRGHFKS